MPIAPRRAGPDRQRQDGPRRGTSIEDQGEEAGKEQEEALADLEDAQDELEQARRDAEEQLAMEQLVRMGDRFKSLAERQEKVVSETASYEALRQKSEGKLTIAQRSRGQRARRGPDRPQGRDAELTENLEGAPVFALTLKPRRRRAWKPPPIGSRAQDRRDSPSRPPRPRPIGSSSFSNRSRPMPAGRGGGGGGGGGGGAAGRRWRRRRRHPARLPSSRCSSRSSRKSTTRTEHSTSYSAQQETVPDQIAELDGLAKSRGCWPTWSAT